MARDGATEKATPRRRREARREGRIAQSREVPLAASLLAALLALQSIGPSLGRTFRDQTTFLLGEAARSTEMPTAALQRSVTTMLQPLPMLLGVLMAAGVAACLSQVGFVFATKGARPKLSHLSPRKGIERFKPGPALWELARSSAKLGLLGVLLIGPVRSWMDSVSERKNLAGSLEDTLAQIFVVLWRVVLLAIVVAAADYAWNRRRMTKQTNMTKQEVKQEYKQTEGDPHIKAARRSKMLAMSRNRMLINVAGADVVITNPTHLAIALVYEPDSPAPKVVAKGADRMAAKIRKEAYRHGVLVTENKPLARELYRRCKVGGYVPATLFEAVALVLAMVYRRRPQKWSTLFGTPVLTAGGNA